MTIPPPSTVIPGAIPWIKYGERLPGKDAATTPYPLDVINRPLEWILRASGYDPDDPNFKFDRNNTIDVLTYGADLLGIVDSTQAFLDTITAAQVAHPGGGTIVVPTGDYLITVPDVLILKSNFSLLMQPGARFIYRPTGDGALLTVNAGASSQSLNNRIPYFEAFSDDVTHTKIGIKLVDVSSFKGGNWYIYGSGSGTPSAPYWTGGTGSIGVMTQGRELSEIKGLRICADYPVYIDQNPNTSPSDGEDMDHFRWTNCYLIGKGHYCITVKTGLGIMNTTWDGYQAWVGGTGGFFMNDTRVTPVVTSRNLNFKNIRTEQCQDANGYVLNISAATHIFSIGIENALGVTGSQGIKIDRCLQLMLDQVIMATAAGKNSLLVTNPIGGCTVDIRSSYFQPASVFTLTGYVPVIIGAWEVGTTVGPSDALYAVTRNDTSIIIAALKVMVAAAINGRISLSDTTQEWGLDVRGTLADQLIIRDVTSGTDILGILKGSATTPANRARVGIGTPNPDVAISLHIVDADNASLKLSSTTPAHISTLSTTGIQVTRGDHGDKFLDNVDSAGDWLMRHGIGSVEKQRFKQNGDILIVGDYDGVGGYQEIVEGYFQDNVPAGQAATEASRANGRWQANKAGSILAVRACLGPSQARTAGTMTVEVFKATIDLATGVRTEVATGLTAVIDTTNPVMKITTQAKDLDTFAAGDEVYAKTATNGSWAPVTADVRITITVES